MKELERENQRLKRIVADQALDIDILKEVNRVLKYLNITDEFSKEALAIAVERSMSGDDIVTILEAVISIHGGAKVRVDG